MKMVTQIGSRGQLTLPADIRKRLGLRPGDTLLVRLEDGHIVLDPAIVLPIEQYTAERMAEFATAAKMEPEDLEQARLRWNL